MTPAVVDFSAAAASAAYTHTLGRDAQIQTDAVIGVLEEAVAAGGFTGTAGDFTVQVVRGGTPLDVAAWSTGTTATGRVIGYEAKATTDATNAPDGYFQCVAGDTLRVVNKAQGAGGTATGTARVFVPIDFDL